MPKSESERRPEIPEPAGGSHVFVLGAGASRAAFPNGDAEGRKLPVMADFIETLGLGDLIERAPFRLRQTNFEETYSQLAGDSGAQGLARELEERVSDYFSRLRMPDRPTLYDHLVLSLRDKDLIATFNWDPFLVQAIIRNQAYAESPPAVFLHGNVAVAYCTRHDRVGIGSPGGTCRICDAPLGRSKLLFPVTRKDYNSDPAIAAAWRVLKSYLKDASAVTFFGYGASTTDVAAVELLKEGWGSPEEREMEETEIIDVAPHEILEDRWSPFIHSHHYRIESSFYDSIAGRSPRRSAEQLFKAHVMAQFITEFPIPVQAGWHELRDFLTPILEPERALRSQPPSESEA